MPMGVYPHTKHLNPPAGQRLGQRARKKPIKKQQGTRVKKKHTTSDPLVEKRRETKIKCPICHKPMIVLQWNRKVDIVTCDNVYCIKYRQPAGNLPVDEVSEAIEILKAAEPEVSSAAKAKGGVNEWKQPYYSKTPIGCQDGALTNA